MKRIVFQFTPYSWVRFEWKPASSLRRWLAVCGIILVVRPARLGFPCTAARAPRHPPLPPVSVGRAEHLLPEVRAVAAPRALPGPPAARLLRQRGRCGHAGDLRLHGRPVRAAWGRGLGAGWGRGLGAGLPSASAQPHLCPQEAAQEAGPAGLAGGCHHGHGAADRGEVRPAHADAVPALLHRPVLDARLRARPHLDCLALLPAVSAAAPGVLPAAAGPELLCGAGSRDPRGLACGDAPLLPAGTSP